MFLVKVVTQGTPVYDDERGNNIGYDNVCSFFALISHEDDLGQWADAEEYRSAKIIDEITHDDMLRMMRQSFRMQGATDAEINAFFHQS